MKTLITITCLFASARVPIAQAVVQVDGYHGLGERRRARSNALTSRASFNGCLEWFHGPDKAVVATENSHDLSTIGGSMGIDFATHEKALLRIEWFGFNSEEAVWPRRDEHDELDIFFYTSLSYALLVVAWLHRINSQYQYDGSDFSGRNDRLFRRIVGIGRFFRPTAIRFRKKMNLSEPQSTLVMIMIYLIGGLIAVGLFIYLCAALLKPEIFS